MNIRGYRLLLSRDLAIAQFAPQIFSDARFGQRGAEFDLARDFISRHALATIIDDLLLRDGRLFFENDEGFDSFPAILIWQADDDGFVDLRMLEQHLFDLARINIVSPGD